MERRLAAVLAYDVVAYSRAMEADEVATLAKIKKHRVDIIEPLASSFSCRVIKHTGDGGLMEFTSVVEAVSFAVAMQVRLAETSDGDDPAQLRYRIGINVGDVLVDGEDIYGDGVNVAARLEGLAAPGGVCVSGNVQSQVSNKLDLEFHDRGEISVKNIERPIHAFDVKIDKKAVSLLEVPAGQPRAERGARSGRNRVTVVAAILILAAASLAYWWWDRPSEPPGEPSIAVLPFDAFSDDVEQRYIAEGMTEDIITDLSKLRGIAVIARNSSFAYGSKGIDVREVGRELGVGTLLEGSVRKLGDKLRINVQLVDARDASHIWADRYDVPYSDVATVQDEIVGKVLTELDVVLSAGEQARLSRSTTVNAKAYDIYLTARTKFVDSLSEDASRNLIAAAEEALDLDPDFTAALLMKGWGHYNLYKYLDGSTETLDDAKDVALQVIDIDPSYGLAYTLLAEAEYALGNVKEAFSASERSAELNPNHAMVLAFRAYYLSDEGKTDQAVAMIDRAIRLNPRPEPWYYNVLGYAYLTAGRYREAIRPLENCIEQLPDYVSCYSYLVPAYMEIGDAEKGRTAAQAVTRLNPDFSIESHSYWVKLAQDPKEKERRTELLIEAGLKR